jgi:hypothetical protein
LVRATVRGEGGLRGGESLKGMNRDKAPGSDDFSIAFFQDYWDVIKTDIMGVFLDFHACCKFERSLNAVFIALILKRSVAIDLKDLLVL